MKSFQDKYPVGTKYKSAQNGRWYEIQEHLDSTFITKCLDTGFKSHHGFDGTILLQPSTIVVLPKTTNTLNLYNKLNEA